MDKKELMAWMEGRALAAGAAAMALTDLLSGEQIATVIDKINEQAYDFLHRAYAVSEADIVWAAFAVVRGQCREDVP